MKEFLPYKIVRNDALKLADKINKEGFVPDVIYDSLRGGAYMANVISELILKTKATLGATSLLVTHDMGSAFMAADKIAMLNEGHIEAMGTVAEIKKSTNPFVQQFIKGELFAANNRKEGAASEQSK